MQSFQHLTQQIHGIHQKSAQKPYFELQSQPQQLLLQENSANFQVSQHHTQSFNQDQTYFMSYQQYVDDKRKKEKLGKKREIKMWSEEEDQLLHQFYNKYPQNWTEIAKHMPQRTSIQCSQRWRRIYPQKQRQMWTKEEDSFLLYLVQQQQSQNSINSKIKINWQEISKKMSNGRSGQQIRQRYVNNLDPMINHAPWKTEEDFMIIQWFKKIGAKWSEISKYLPGRPENMIKNRFHSYIKKAFAEEINNMQVKNELLFEEEDDQYESQENNNTSNQQYFYTLTNTTADGDDLYQGTEQSQQQSQQQITTTENDEIQNILDDDSWNQDEDALENIINDLKNEQFQEQTPLYQYQQNQQQNLLNSDNQVNKNKLSIELNNNQIQNQILNQFYNDDQLLEIEFNGKMSLEDIQNNYQQDYMMLQNLKKSDDDLQIFNKNNQFSNYFQ